MTHSFQPAPRAWPSARPIRLRGVTLRRGPSEVLREVDLAFEPGVRYAIVGASGAGKSSLLRLLNRLDDPDEGVVEVGGVGLKELPTRSVRSAVGLVFQAPRPLPGSLAANLLYPYEVRGRPGPDRASLARALEEVGLDPARLDRDARELSGGERQRLAIASALGIAPEVLALDEPTSALDPASARRVIELLNARAESDGLRTIVVTHNPDHAARLADVVVRLEAGRVEDVGPSAEVLARVDASAWGSP